MPLLTLCIFQLRLELVVDVPCYVQLALLLTVLAAFVLVKLVDAYVQLLQLYVYAQLLLQLLYAYALLPLSLTLLLQLYVYQRLLLLQLQPLAFAFQLVWLLHVLSLEFHVLFSLVLQLLLFLFP